MTFQKPPQDPPPSKSKPEETLYPKITLPDPADEPSEEAPIPLQEIANAAVVVRENANTENTALKQTDNSIAEFLESIVSY